MELRARQQRLMALNSHLQKRPLVPTVTLLLAVMLCPQLALAGQPLATKATSLHRGDAIAGLVPSSYPIHIEMALKLRNQDQLRRFASEKKIGDVHVMPRDQLMANHAPTQSQAQRVAAYLKQSGFTNIKIASNRMLVSADGTAATAQMAFLTSIVSVHTHDGRNAYANIDDAQVPASLQDTVLAVVGLQTVHRPQIGAANTLVGQPPTEFPLIYGANSVASAAGVTVGILTQGNVAQAVTDLNSFTSANKLATVVTSTVNTNGTSTDTSNLLEWDLDSQSIVGMAGGQLGKIIFYNVPTLSNANLIANINAVASANAAKIINVSLGECETTAQADGSAAAADQIFLIAAAQGQTFSISTGDYGANECGSQGVGASWPADSQYVVAVAGTTLSVDPNTNDWQNETVWSGSGGSESTFEPKPSWQTLWAGTRRGVADVAFDADPRSGATVVVNGSMQQIGGTSLSAPLFAGLWARVIGVKGVDLGFAGPLLYALPQSDFHDITVGSNGGSSAAVGYDLASGRGSLILNSAIKDFKPSTVRMSGDFNGDGKSDILWRNTFYGTNTIWLSGNSAAVQAVATADVNWKIVGVGDFNGDHVSDILFRNSVSGNNVIWLSANADTPQSVNPVASQTWQVAGVGDFNGDGKADILWRKSTDGSNTIWLSGNSVTVQTVTAVTSQDWQIAGNGDFNADDKADIVWHNSDDGRSSIWFSGNSSTWQSVTAVDPLSAWAIRGVGDFNGDGKADLVWRNSTTGQDTIWLTANSATVKATDTGDRAWRIVSTGDFNGDHVSDFLWRNDTDGRNTIWFSASIATWQTVTPTGLAWMVAP